MQLVESNNGGMSQMPGSLACFAPQRDAGFALEILLIFVCDSTVSALHCSETSASAVSGLFIRWTQLDWDRVDGKD